MGQEKIEDDEIEIDFSKITNLFKSGKKEKKVEDKEDKDDEEISFDFNKVKNFFKSEKKESDDEDIAMDWGSVKGFFKKHQTLFLLLIPLFLSIFLRVQPAYLPITDDWATDTVMNGIRGQVNTQINQQYPNLPDQNKNALVNTEMGKIIKEQKGQIDQQITSLSLQFKSQLKDDEGTTYLLAIDPYFWMRKAKNVVDHGHPGDRIVDGMQWNDYMYAPLGREVSPDMLHGYFEGYMYKIISFFKRDLSLMRLAFYMPILISALSVIPAFFIVRRAGGNVGALFASTMVAVHAGFVSRTAGGFSDTDAYNVFFPLLITWIFIEAFEAKEMKKKLIFGGLSGFFVGLYSLAWTGWWYSFDFILGAIGIYLIYIVLINRKSIGLRIMDLLRKDEFKRPLFLLVIFFVSSLIFVSFFMDFAAFQNFEKGPMAFIKLKDVAVGTVWPNVYTTVAEQNPSSLPAVISQIGGKFLFFLSLMGILFTMIRKDKSRKGEFLFFGASMLWFLYIIYSLPGSLNTFLLAIAAPVIIKLFLIIKNKDTSVDMKYAALLILWFIGTIYASVKGVRYLLLLVPGFSIGFGIFAGVVYKNVSKWVSKELHINDIITKTTVFILLALLLINPIKAGYGTAVREIPSMNDAWYNALNKIDMEAAPDAIINSWWDFGHWFKMIGNRAVTFDGTSQNTPMAHWVGKSLITRDEKQAISILRMLDCGSHRAFDELDAVIQHPAESIDLLNDVILLSRTGAERRLEQAGVEDTEAVLQYTHCDPPENYYITSQDMIGKSGVWGHFGSWDFWRASMYNEVNNKNNIDGIKILMDEFEMSEEEADKIYYEIQTQDPNNWITPWPSYQGGTAGCSATEDMITCGNGLIFNRSTEEAFIPTQEGLKHLEAISIPTNDGLKIIEFSGNSVPLGAALIGKENSFSSILMSPELVGSTFTKLFFYKGHGSEYFEPFSYQRTVFGGEIFVWKVDWEGKDAYLVDEFIVQENEE